MARRRGRSKTVKRRRTPKAQFNLLNIAESFVLANAGTNFAFGTNLIPFLTEGWLTNQTSATDNSWELSASELFGLVTGQGGGIAQNFGNGDLMSVLKYNIRSTKGKQALATMILAPVLFRAGKKLASPAIRSSNKLIRQAGLGSLVKI